MNKVYVIRTKLKRGKDTKVIESMHFTSRKDVAVAINEHRREEILLHNSGWVTTYWKTVELKVSTL